MTRTNSVKLFIGKKGSGKTTRVRGELVHASRRIIIDPMHEYTEGVIVTSFDALVAWLAPMRHKPRYSVILRTMDDGERDAAIALAVEGTPDAPPLPDVTLVIDEVDRICTPYQIPDGLRRVVNYGRHFGIDVLAACRRPRAMHRDLTANADTIIIGQTQEPGDLDYLREFIGRELADRAAKLGRWEFVTYPDDLTGGADNETVAGAVGGPMGPGADAAADDVVAGDPSPGGVGAGDPGAAPGGAGEGA